MYNRAIQCKTEQLNQILNILNRHSVEYHTYTNMRVLMDELRQEISLLVKAWDEIPERAKTEIRLLAYSVIECEIDTEELAYLKL